MEDLGLVKTLRSGHFSQHEAACGAERQFLNAHIVCAHAGAQSFFCVEARTPASCKRYGHLVLLPSVRSWPFQQRAGHRCASFHTLLTISRLILLKHVPAIAPTPFVPTPLTDTKYIERTGYDTCGHFKVNLEGFMSIRNCRVICGYHTDGPNALVTLDQRGIKGLHPKEVPVREKSEFGSHRHFNTTRKTTPETNNPKMPDMTQVFSCFNPHACVQTAVRTMMLVR